MPSELPKKNGIGVVRGLDRSVANLRTVVHKHVTLPRVIQAVIQGLGHAVDRVGAVAGDLPRIAAWPCQ